MSTDADTTPRTQRKRPLKTLSLAQETHEQLAELSKRTGLPESRLVEQWTHAAFKRSETERAATRKGRRS
ncbi:MAG: hypothetical protein ACHQQR_04400 [Gemmatimonadales bacterium]